MRLTNEHPTNTRQRPYPTAIWVRVKKPPHAEAVCLLEGNRWIAWGDRKMRVAPKVRVGCPSSFWEIRVDSGSTWESQEPGNDPTECKWASYIQVVYIPVCLWVQGRSLWLHKSMRPKWLSSSLCKETLISVIGRSSTGVWYYGGFSKPLPPTLSDSLPHETESSWVFELPLEIHFISKVISGVFIASRDDSTCQVWTRVRSSVSLQSRNLIPTETLSFSKEGTFSLYSDGILLMEEVTPGSFISKKADWLHVPSSIVVSVECCFPRAQPVDVLTCLGVQSRLNSPLRMILNRDFLHSLGQKKRGRIVPRRNGPLKYSNFDPNSRPKQPPQKTNKHFKRHRRKEENKYNSTSEIDFPKLGDAATAQDPFHSEVSAREDIHKGRMAYQTCIKLPGSQKSVNQSKICCVHPPPVSFDTIHYDFPPLNKSLPYVSRDSLYYCNRSVVVMNPRFFKKGI